MNSFDSSTSEEVGPTVFQTGVWVRFLFYKPLSLPHNIALCYLDPPRYRVRDRHAPSI